MQEPLVTVIIPNYNYGYLVNRAIESVCAQSYKNIEIFVINDGSTDSSDETIKTLKESYSFTYIDQENQGIVNVRNKGVEISSGDFIIQLDADDYIPDNYVSTLVDAAKNSKADIFYTKAINPATDEIIVYPREFDKELLKHQNYIHASSMYRKSLFNNNQYDEWLNGYAFEDWDFNLGSVLRGSEAVLVKGTHLYYEQHSSGRSAQSRDDSIKEQEAIFYIIDKYYNQYPMEMRSPRWLVKNIKKLIDTRCFPSKERAHFINKIEKLNNDIVNLRQYEHLYTILINSNSYRIGRKLTLPVRCAKEFKRYAGKRYVMQKNIARVKQVIHDKYGVAIAGKLGRPQVSLIVRSIEHPTSSTFIRMISPLRILLEQTKQKLELVDGDRPVVASSTEVVIVQRTALIDLDAAKLIVGKVKQNKAKLFVDTDDAFSELDKTHPQYELQKERIDALNYAIKHADEVWFSTPKLQEFYGLKKSKVVHNTLDEKIWDKLRKEEVAVPGEEKPLEILYMGTKTHDGDFKLVLPVFEQLYAKYPGEFRLHIIGVASVGDSHPWLVDHPPTDGLYPNFIQWLNTLGPFDVGISPLEDTEFNRNKSDIKCLDYLALGLKPVVSDVEAYRNPELDQLITRVNNSQGDWFGALEQEIQHKAKSRKSMSKQAKAGYEYIKKYRLTDKPAKQIQVSLDEA